MARLDLIMSNDPGVHEMLMEQAAQELEDLQDEGLDFDGLGAWIIERGDWQQWKDYAWDYAEMFAQNIPDDEIAGYVFDYNDDEEAARTLAAQYSEILSSMLHTSPDYMYEWLHKDMPSDGYGELDIPLRHGWWQDNPDAQVGAVEYMLERSAAANPPRSNPYVPESEVRDIARYIADNTMMFVGPRDTRAIAEAAANELRERTGEKPSRSLVLHVVRLARGYHEGIKRSTKGNPARKNSIGAALVGAGLGYVAGSSTTPDYKEMRKLAKQDQQYRADIGNVATEYGYRPLSVPTYFANEAVDLANNYGLSVEQLAAMSDDELIELEDRLEYGDEEEAGDSAAYYEAREAGATISEAEAMAAQSNPGSHNPPRGARQNFDSEQHDNLQDWSKTIQGLWDRTSRAAIAVGETGASRVARVRALNWESRATQEGLARDDEFELAKESIAREWRQAEKFAHQWEEREWKERGMNNPPRGARQNPLPMQTQAAWWAQGVAEALASRIPGARAPGTRLPELSVSFAPSAASDLSPTGNMVLGIIKYPKGYISFQPHVGGSGGNQFWWARVVAFGPNDYRQGFGFVTNGRRIATIQESDGSPEEIAQELISLVPGVGAQYPTTNPPPSWEKLANVYRLVKGDQYVLIFPYKPRAKGRMGGNAAEAKYEYEVFHRKGKVPKGTKYLVELRHRGHRPGYDDTVSLGAHKTLKAAKHAGEMKLGGTFNPPEIRDGHWHKSTLGTSPSYELSAGEGKGIARVVPYAPRKYSVARGLAASYEKQAGGKIPKGTAWLTWALTRSREGAASYGEVSGRITAHKTLKAAKAAGARALGLSAKRNSPKSSRSSSYAVQVRKSKGAKAAKVQLPKGAGAHRVNGKIVHRAVSYAGGKLKLLKGWTVSTLAGLGIAKFKTKAAAVAHAKR